MSRSRFHISAGAVLAAALLLFFLDTATLWAIALPVAAHELGHVLALRLAGLRIRSFRAEMKGLCIEYSGFCGTAGHVFAAAAGPLAGLAYAFAASRWAKLSGSETAALSAGISLLLSLFNLLPVLPLDGGRIFSRLACSLMGCGRGERLCRDLGLAVGTAALALGLLLMWQGMGAGLAAAAVWLLLAQPEGEGIVKRKEIL